MSRGLDPETRALFDEAAPFEEPTFEDRARIQAKVAARAGAAVFASGGVGLASKAAAASTGAKAAASTGALAKGAAVLALVAAAGGGAYGVRRHAAWLETEHAARPPVPASALAVTPTPAAARSPSPSPPPSESAPSQDQARTPSRAEPTLAAPPSESSPPSAWRRAPSASSAHEGSFQEELALVGEAQRALREGDAPRALALTDRHAALFPRGQLSEERAGVRTLSLCTLGRPGARALGERFVREHPTAPLAGRVRSVCELDR